MPSRRIFQEALKATFIESPQQWPPVTLEWLHCCNWHRLPASTKMANHHCFHLTLWGTINTLLAWRIKNPNEFPSISATQKTCEWKRHRDEVSVLEVSWWPRRDALWPLPLVLLSASCSFPFRNTENRTGLSVQLTFEIGALTQNKIKV